MEFKQIVGSNGFEEFRYKVDNLHDCILRECIFLGGAYIDENRWMHNDSEPGVCRMVFQSQCEDTPVIVIEIDGVSKLCINTTYVLQLDGDVKEGEITLFLAGRDAIHEKYYVTGRSVKYCILDRSYIGKDTRLLIKEI